MRTLLSLFAFALLLVACDSGDIPEREYTIEKTGLTANLTGLATGLADWGDKYELVLAAFDDQSDYSLVQKDLPSSHPDGTALNFTLAGIPPTANTIELCVVGRLRDRIATLAEVKITDEMRANPRTPIVIDLGTKRLDRFGVVEGTIFHNRCEGCHKGATPPRGLSLEAGRSHAQLVGVVSRVLPPEMRVVAGDASKSWLIKILEAPHEALRFDHSKFFAPRSDGRSTQGELELLKHWINEGAPS